MATPAFRTNCFSSCGRAAGPPSCFRRPDPSGSRANMNRHGGLAGNRGRAEETARKGHADGSASHHLQMMTRGVCDRQRLVPHASDDTPPGIGNALDGFFNSQLSHPLARPMRRRSARNYRLPPFTSIGGSQQGKPLLHRHAQRRNTGLPAESSRAAHAEDRRGYPEPERLTGVAALTTATLPDPQPKKTLLSRCSVLNGDMALMARRGKVARHTWANVPTRASYLKTGRAKGLARCGST